MIRLVAFDLDGTVLSDTGEASAASIGAIRALLDAGIAVASVSGRNVEKSQAPFPPDLAGVMYVGSYNGAVVLGAGVGGPRPVLHEQRLEEEAFREAVDFVGERGLNFIYCRCEVDGKGVREAYMADRESASVRKLRQMTGLRFAIDGDLAVRIRGGEFGPPPKMIVLPGPERRDGVLREMQGALGGRLYLARTGDDRIEAMHPEVNKGEALRAICRARGIPAAEALAIGDGDNDLPMLRAAGVGVLMGNADAQTKGAVAGAGIETAPAFEAEGFTGAVERFVLGERDR